MKIHGEEVQPDLTELEEQKEARFLSSFPWGSGVTDLCFFLHIYVFSPYQLSQLKLVSFCLLISTCMWLCW